MKQTMLNICLSLLCAFSISCSSGSDDSQPTGDDDGGIVPIIPSALVLNITKVGASEQFPNGDGSGTIQCTASAIDAVSYGFRFGNGEEIPSTDGTMEFTYTNPGTNNYTIYVFAYSSTNHNISTSESISLYVDDSVQLVWSDEFDVNGAPDTSKWGYNIGTGQSGWGNNESQYYTDRADNAIVENGVLKIIAKRENYQGSEFTSARLLTKDKFEFTHGKVEIRAKLPEGGGTWPALWLLGANIDGVGWPACGETDIMEHVGNNQGYIQSAIHTPSSFGNTSNLGGQQVANVSSEFHTYELEWTSEKMVFSVDGNVHYTYQPSNKNDQTWPFDLDQFIIMNVAMGGNLGGTIDPNFMESTMEVDYVRVYQ
ncbi:family 16 glycosylhydrolase [Mangrovimonas sp. DI 80]|uniref:family 16 glycosylhydrolase n=1 Tax=Mangrovimonas sp. DI 80 TaxID=1779330 RepID=UPI0009755DC5|nr:family 16 glycosylhydrolase [Mangrovimonas sp. DI 80]OMP32440.1 hypothetical protein BKM32_05175 [Mangrovimonas sp. DI 80]